MKSASKYANVIHESVFEEDDSTLVLEVLAIAELHIFMGGVNCPVKLLIQIYGQDVVDGWLRQINVIRRGYHGGTLDGNNSMKLLDNLDRFAEIIPPSCAPIVANLQALKAVAKGLKRERERERERHRQTDKVCPVGQQCIWIVSFQLCPPF